MTIRRNLPALCLLWAALCVLRPDGAAAQTAKRVVPVSPTDSAIFDRQLRAAVVVGIGKYPESSGLAPLQYTGDDASAVAAELRKQGYTVRLLLDSEASRSVLRRTLRELAQTLEPNQGTLVFYFSGHGFAIQGVNYLATFGATADDLADEGMKLSDVQSLMQMAKPKRQMLFVDACRNEALAGVRGASGRSFQDLESSEGVRTLLSTRPGNFSYEDPSLKHGVFTSFLLRGLQGAAVGSDGLVTFRDLTDYVTSEMKAYSLSTGKLQIPREASSDAEGDFIIARTAPARPAPAPALPPTTYAPPPKAPTPAPTVSNTADQAVAVIDMDKVTAGTRDRKDVRTAVTKYASDHGITMVLDVAGQPNNMMFASTARDITNDIILAMDGGKPRGAQFNGGSANLPYIVTINMQEALVNTKDGRKAVADLQAKYGTQTRQEGQARRDEDERKLIADLGGKIMPVVTAYAGAHSEILLIDVGGQPNNVVFSAGTLDITKEIVSLYDSGVKPQPAAAGQRAHWSEAVIDMQGALLATGDGKKASADLQAKFGPLEQDFARRSEELQKKQAQFTSASASMSDQAKTALAAEIERLTQSLQRDTEDAKGQLNQEEQKIIGPLLGKITQVLTKYATDRQIALIFDVSGQQNNILYAGAAINITDQIVAEYDRQK
jgi:Skp family chaperone for outer membrane proteins